MANFTYIIAAIRFFGEQNMAKITKLDDIVSLCKRRGFIFQSSEIYGGLASCYDYGPLGVELKSRVKMAGAGNLSKKICPACGAVGQFTEPMPFKLMFETQMGANVDDSMTMQLRPETAQGIFVNFRNVLDSTRVKIPFGIAQIGKSFRNEVTTKAFIFRTRE